MSVPRRNTASGRRSTRERDSVRGTRLECSFRSHLRSRCILSNHSCLCLGTSSLLDRFSDPADVEVTCPWLIRVSGRPPGSSGSSPENRSMVGEEEVMLNTEQQQSTTTYVGSYLYLRTAIVLLLVGLAAAVFYQYWQQGGPLLASVSAYYYTPAQVIFVGSLIGLGACMVALKGMTVVEDVFLN